MKDLLAAFLALGVSPAAEALMTALVDEVEKARQSADASVVDELTARVVVLEQQLTDSELIAAQFKERMTGIESEQHNANDFHGLLSERVEAVEQAVSVFGKPGPLVNMSATPTPVDHSAAQDDNAKPDPALVAAAKKTR